MNRILRTTRASTFAISVAATGAGWTSAASAQTAVTLDPITVLATKTDEKTTDSLAAVSAVRGDQIGQIMPNRISDVFSSMPSVWFQERADDPGTSINIRGLQDFGRVAVLIDGARQNFQRSGHNADGLFYMEPELLAGADVVRGPVAISTAPARSAASSRCAPRMSTMCSSRASAGAC